MLRPIVLQFRERRLFHGFNLTQGSAKHYRRLELYAILLRKNVPACQNRGLKLSTRRGSLQVNGCNVKDLMALKNRWLDSEVLSSIRMPNIFRFSHIG